jgi:hypothetical protein
MFALQSTGLCLTAAGRHDETVDIEAAALKQARRLKARRYEAIILAVCAEQALVAGRATEALSPVRSGLEASEETSPGFVGPILFGLLALAEPSPAAQETALSAGESLLAKGAVGHNHFWFRRYAIEWALRAGDWNAANRHAEALLKRTEPEPLSYSSYLVRRGQLLARVGCGGASESDLRELSELRASAGAAGLRLDVLGEAMRQ